MKKLNEASIKFFILTFLGIVCAMLARALAISGFFPRLTSIFRSLLYIVIFISWGIFIRQRIIGNKAKNCLTTISALMVLWFLVRSLKYFYVKEAVIARYLWYLYYPALIFIPMFMAITAITIGKKDDDPFPKSTTFLYLPSIILVILVLTNDWHQLVFKFPSDSNFWSDKSYSYGVGYLIIVIWLLLCAFTLLFTMLKKRRVADKHKLIILPCLPIFVLILYLIFYVLGIPFLRLFFGDMAAVFCLMYVLTVEISIYCGFIQANTHYAELFRVSTVATKIVDDNYKVIISSNRAEDIELSILKQMNKEHIIYEKGIRLLKSPIKVGYVVWSENISQVLNTLDELEKMKNVLEENNKLEEKENELKKHKAHILEQKRLYNSIGQNLISQLNKMETLIKKVESSESKEEKSKLLSQLLVIGSYIKRRSNLSLLAEKELMANASELYLCIQESERAIECCGISLAYSSEIYGDILTTHIILMYELFEKVIEHILGQECFINVYIKIKEGNILFKLVTDVNIDLLQLKSDQVTVEKDEDGEQTLIMKLSKGERFL